MKRIFYSLFVSVLVFMGAATAAAQAGPPETDDDRPRRHGDGRGSLLRELGLTPEQARAIRTLNQERRPLMEEAQRKVRSANRDLDDAIYADRLDEKLVASRILAVQEAQAEVSRIRFQNELAVRKILRPEQLLHFRELRANFEKARRGEGPLRRGNRRRGNDRGPMGPGDGNTLRNDHPH